MPLRPSPKVLVSLEVQAMEGLVNIRDHTKGHSVDHAEAWGLDPGGLRLYLKFYAATHTEQTQLQMTAAFVQNHPI